MRLVGAHLPELAHQFVEDEQRVCAAGGPPLDPALLSAILSDFDLTNESDVQRARLTLDPLKESASLEEQAGFDASGTGAGSYRSPDEPGTESCPGTNLSQSRETDFTSVSNGHSSQQSDLVVENAIPDPGTPQDLEELDEDTKIQLLLDVFQDRIPLSRARYILQKCKGNWHRAMEELLNHVYFDEAESSDNGSKISSKGIDAFSEDRLIHRGRKGKGKNKSVQLSAEGRSSSLPVSPVDAMDIPQSNRWQNSTKDIEFITSRTNLSTKSVTSSYYSSGASLPQTIAAILKSSVQINDRTDDPILAVNAHDLATEFPSISPEYAYALVRLTHPSSASAHELAKIMTASDTQSRGGLQVITNYKRLDPDQLDANVRVINRNSPASASVAVHSAVDAFEAADYTSAYAARRHQALLQARAAHRKAKSDRLMGGAAAYYGQLGREYGEMTLKATAAAADDLAAAQSTSLQVDLHGIDVLNAVRIAQERVEKWWNSLGEARFNGRIGLGERQSGYRIVVGLGKHSEGGRGKLGPAVSKMLKNGGWRYESEGAVLLVKGRVRT